MKRTYVITLLNNKGGVGKTTGSINLSAGLAELGKTVVLIDADSQRNATIHVAKELMASDAMTLTPFLVNDDVDIADAIVETAIPNLNMIMADLDIHDTLEIYSKKWARPAERLKEKLVRLNGLVDYIIIDTPPAISLVVENALAASTHFIIPVDQGGYSQMGLVNLESKLLRKIYQINPTLKCLGVLPSMMKKNTAIEKHITETKEFGDDKFPKIPVVLPYRQSVYNDSHTGEITVRPGSKTDIAQAYRELAEFVVSQTNKDADSDGKGEVA